MTFSRDGKRIDFVDLPVLTIKHNESAAYGDEINIGDATISVPATELYSGNDGYLLWRRGCFTCLIFVGYDETCERIMDLRDAILAEHPDS